MTSRMILPFLAGVIGTAILLSLGIWQVQRLVWKEAVLAEIDARINSAPVPVPVSPDPERDRYLPVAATGKITTDEVHVLISQKSAGAGFRIIAAFETGGRRILLDRGFVDVTAKDAPRPAVTAAVTGNLHWPQEIDRWTPEPDLAENIWFARDVPALARTLNAEPVLIIARKTSVTTPAVTALPVDSAGIPNDHLEYAITWFSLAAVWVGMTAFLLWRIRQGRA